MADRALRTPEIFYLILSLLPQQDILLAQRVSRYWRDNIRNDRLLMQALFLLPKYQSQNDDDGVVFNPLLLSKFPAFFRTLPTSFGIPQHDHGPGPWYGSHWAANVDLATMIHPGYDTLPELDARRAAAYKRPEASWRRMCPCIPAIRELQVARNPFSQNVDGRIRLLQCWLFEGDHHRLASDDLASASSLTFGMVYDIVEAAWFDEHPYPATSVQFVYKLEGPGSVSHFSCEDLNSRLPGKKVGGEGRLLVKFTHNSRKPPWKPKLYHGQFRVEGSVIPPCDEEYQVRD